MKKSFAVVLTVVALTFLLAATAFSADKLIVKDSGGTNTVFSVTDTGEVFAGGTDANNAFQIQVMGHTGGASHVQLVTNQTNSRISLIGSSATDFAPRWQAIGPQDPSNPGWEIFDYGSNLFNLPNATFKLRHYNMTGPQDMISIVGRSTVSFPAGKVGVGTTNPARLFSVGTGGAGSDGTVWFTSSSREYKNNIQPLSKDQAIKTIENMTPVTYVYKTIPDYTHVGFIAEDVPNLVATPDRKTLSTMDIVAVLTKVVQEQQKAIAELTEKVNLLQGKVSKIGNKDVVGRLIPE